MQENVTNEFDTLYRYEESLFQHSYHEIDLYLNKYKIVKQTPKGFWIWTGIGSYETYLSDRYITNSDSQNYAKEQLKAGLKWVNNTSKKRFAYPTEKEAQINFKKRKERQIRILEAQLDNTKNALKAINKLINKTN